MVTTFSNGPQQVLTGLDNVVVPQLLSAIPGGRTLDVEGFAASVIPAGWVVVTDGNGKYKPLGATAAYAKTKDTALVEGKDYFTESSGVYTKVASPVVGSIGSYYELTGEQNYTALPDGWAYAGFVACSVKASKPAATVMTAGQINEAAAPNAASLATIKSAISAALPTIQFVKDENA